MLDQTFHALADGTRRDILVALTVRPDSTVSELAKPLSEPEHEPRATSHEQGGGDR
jgi:DNA-binding transcriptional ArsR family regulator